MPACGASVQMACYGPWLGVRSAAGPIYGGGDDDAEESATEHRAAPIGDRIGAGRVWSYDPADNASG